MLSQHLSGGFRRLRKLLQALQLLEQRSRRLSTYHAPRTHLSLQRPQQNLSISPFGTQTSLVIHSCAHLHRDSHICPKTPDPGVINTQSLAPLRVSTKKDTGDRRTGLPFRLCFGFAVVADATYLRIRVAKKNVDNDLRSRWLTVGLQSRREVGASLWTAPPPDPRAFPS